MGERGKHVQEKQSVTLNCSCDLSGNMAGMNNEQEASLILSQMNPGYKYEGNGNGTEPVPQASTSTTALPPLPPLPVPAPAQPPRRARQAKLAAQAMTSQQNNEDLGEEDDGDGDDDDADGAFEEDMLHYDASDFNFDGSGMMEGTPSGSVSPRSNRPRGRKPKSTFGAGVPKDSNEYQKLR